MSEKMIVPEFSLEFKHLSRYRSTFCIIPHTPFRRNIRCVVIIIASKDKLFEPVDVDPDNLSRRKISCHFFHPHMPNYTLVSPMEQSQY